MQDQIVEIIQNICTKTRGRPKLSVSHKKRQTRTYLDQKKLRKIADGTYKPRGRPKKEM
jgi:hypothetical protein